MPRPTRIKYKGAKYHVFNRGNNKCEIFKSEGDYKFFLKLCNKYCQPLNYFVHCYCLMPNHFHFFIETPEANLSEIMQQISSQYTMFFNKKYNRCGHLFQGRYKNKEVKDLSYALELSRYIHLNPVYAGIVNKASEFKWSSYKAYKEVKPTEKFNKVDWLSNIFNGNNLKSVTNFHEYTNKSDTRNIDFESCSYWKNSKFMVSTQEDLKIQNQEEIISNINEQLNNYDLNNRIKKEMTAYLLRGKTKLKLKEIGEIIGGSKEDATRKMVKGFDKKLKVSPYLESIVKEIM